MRARRQSPFDRLRKAAEGNDETPISSGPGAVMSPRSGGMLRIQSYERGGSASCGGGQGD
jgi:hypothetical protein